MRLTQLPKVVVKLLENVRILYTNGMVIQRVWAFHELKKFLGNICSFEQLFYRKKSLGAPDYITVGLFITLVWKTY